MLLTALTVALHFETGYLALSVLLVWPVVAGPPLGLRLRRAAVLLAYNYGEAAAIDYLGGRYALPKAASGHNQYGYWGPRRASADVAIAIGYNEGFLRQFFGDVQAAAQVNPKYALPEERNLTVFVCRHPKTTLQRVIVRL